MPKSTVTLDEIQEAKRRFESGQSLQKIALEMDIAVGVLFRLKEKNWGQSKNAPASEGQYIPKLFAVKKNGPKDDAGDNTQDGPRLTGSEVIIPSTLQDILDAQLPLAGKLTAFASGVLDGAMNGDIRPGLRSDYAEFSERIANTMIKVQQFVRETAGLKTGQPTVKREAEIKKGVMKRFIVQTPEEFQKTKEERERQQNAS